MSDTIDDVVKRLRDRAERRRKSGKLLQIDDKMFDLIADDIEKAIEVERKEWRKMLKEAKDAIGILEERCDAVEQCQTEEATCKESLQVGNAAKMREALKYLRDASREFCHLICNSKYIGLMDKYKYAEVSKIRDAIANAGVTLSAPARNCDVYRTKKERDAAYKKYREYVIMSNDNPFIAQDEMMSKEEWFFAEAKGEEK